MDRRELLAEPGKGRSRKWARGEGARGETHTSQGSRWVCRPRESMDEATHPGQSLANEFASLSPGFLPRAMGMSGRLPSARPRGALGSRSQVSDRMGGSFGWEDPQPPVIAAKLSVSAACCLRPAPPWGSFSQRLTNSSAAPPHSHQAQGSGLDLGSSGPTAKAVDR